ncbi:MAG: hypothetical protein CEE40_02810 [Chloroflexi bacterium B3_Chlor]|nr:MAG: hypothetical protein CEE40_02810 [Chloroflexi bacterium B3_Chlor]
MSLYEFQGKQSRVLGGAFVAPEATVIGPSCRIGHGAVIRGASLGSHVIVGMHAVIHDGVTIGADCVVISNLEIPAAKMIIGAPGKILGDVSEEERAAWDWGLELYDGLPSCCKESLRRL